MTVADVNGDHKLDVVAVTEDAVVWYENPSWRKHDIIRKATARDNVCIQPHDIDGDGRVDFAWGRLAPTDTSNAEHTPVARPRPGRPLAAPSHPVRRAHAAPTALGRREGDGPEAARRRPLQGRGTKGPDWGDGQGVHVVVYDVPENPESDAWPAEIAELSLHTIHNLQLVDMDGDHRDEIVVACLGRRVRARPRVDRDAGPRCESALATRDQSRPKGQARSRSGG